MKKTILALAFAVVSAVAWALPTTQQVEAQVQQGHYAQAESMLSEVVAAKPGSARAHYVYAEVLAHNGNFAKAAEEAKKAAQIDPNITFTEPQKFQAFQQLLLREQNPSAQNPPARARLSSPAVLAPTMATQAAPGVRSGTPTWVWGLGLLVLAVVAWRGLARSRSVPAAGASSGAAGGVPAGGGFGATGNPSAAANTGVPYGPGGMPAAARPANGMLGTGLAVAGGVAGGMLLDQMLHRRPDAAGGTAPSSGLEPGMFDSSQADAAANELEARPVDFGNGDDDWDAGGGSVDMGGGGSNGDGWS